MTTSLIDPAAQATLQRLLDQTKQEYRHFLGFPATLDFDYSELTPLLGQFLNNIGDPMVETWHTLSSKQIEQEVLESIAQLFRAQPGEWWGYVTNGSTESNLYALYLARQKFPGAKVYYSQSAHYGVAKNIHILAQQGVAIRSLESGEMDYRDLASKVDKGEPAIVLATIGTTMTEARDSVAKIRQCLQNCGVTDYYIHSDAALTGVYAPFLDPRPSFDFADGADSVSVSGHKFIGSPMPCGVVIVRKKDKECLGTAINYTGAIDTTISGSRSGHTPLFLWYALERWGVEGLRQRAQESLAVAEYTHTKLQSIGWNTWRNPQSITVMLAAPPKELIYKWQLATQGEWSHIICMPGVTKAKTDRFVEDLKSI